VVTIGDPAWVTPDRYAEIVERIGPAFHCDLNCPTGWVANSGNELSKTESLIRCHRACVAKRSSGAQPFARKSRRPSGLVATAPSACGVAGSQAGIAHRRSVAAGEPDALAEGNALRGTDPKHPVVQGRVADRGG
jgi:hypothetical protein